jgi:translation initiation factor eIF-2B subunit delta
MPESTQQTKATKPPAADKSAAADNKSKSAKDLKKEKRAAAVAARGGEPDTPGGSKEKTSSKDAQSKAGSSGKTGAKGSTSASAVTAGAAPTSAAALRQQTQNQLFSHLPTYKLPDSAEALISGKIHPIIIRYGILIASGQIRGVNARTIGLMAAFKEVIRGFSCPPEELHRLLPAHLSPMIAFLDQCRPKGVGGGNAIR